MNPHDSDGDGLLDVTLCKACNCMTHTVGVICGKCKAFKVTHTMLVAIAAEYLNKRLPVVLPEFFSAGFEPENDMEFRSLCSQQYAQAFKKANP